MADISFYSQLPVQGDAENFVGGVAQESPRILGAVDVEVAVFFRIAALSDAERIGDIDVTAFGLARRRLRYRGGRDR